MKSAYAFAFYLGTELCVETYDTAMASYTNNSKQVTCEKCPYVRSALLSPLSLDSDTYGKHLGLMREYFYGSCPLHAYLLKPLLAILPMLEDGLPQTASLSVYSNGPQVVTIRTFDSLISSKLRGKELKFDQIVGKGISSPNRLLNDWVDLDVLRGWRNKCAADHQECKGNAFSSIAPDTTPFLLIDVHNMCLKTTTYGDQYVALSYVWGQTLNLKTLANNFQRHQERGAFHQGQTATLIPATTATQYTSPNLWGNAIFGWIHYASFRMMMIFAPVSSMPWLPYTPTHSSPSLLRAGSMQIMASEAFKAFQIPGLGDQTSMWFLCQRGKLCYIVNLGFESINRCGTSVA